MTKVFIWPDFNTPDNGDGGVRRVVEAQLRHLPSFGIEIVRDPAEADVLACHIQIPEEYLRRFPDKAIVAHCHGAYWSEYQNEDGSSQWLRWALQANLDVIKATLAADIVTAPSEWVAQTLRRHTARDVRNVPHGIDLDEWVQGPPHPSMPVLWNKSRPDAVCDPEPVYRLAQRLPALTFLTTFGVENEHPPTNVNIVGRMPYAQAKKLVELAAVYLGTTRETFGIGTLEALAAGVPVVGFDWGGQREFIEHSVDGWLSRPFDYDDLARGVEWGLKARMDGSTAMRRKAEMFPWSKPMQMYADIYREAAARRAEPRPKVSVIVTAYNLEKYLPLTLTSVKGQTLTDWECIIVDDASPDRCGKIADEFAASDPRFVAVHNEKNQYLAGARNVGIAASRGKYILPLDADDMLEPHTLEVLSQALDTQRETHVAYGGVFFVNEDGTPTDYGHERGPGFSGWPVDFRIDHQLMAPRPGQRPNNLLPYCSMIRREALELTGGYRKRRKNAEDADLWCRLASYGFTPRMVTRQPTLIYRNREESMSRTVPYDDWTAWYPGSRNPELSPAGALRDAHLNKLDVHSLDPPIISVIIPLGPEHGELVVDAIDSVDAQSFRQWECIVVIDDVSPPLPRVPSWVRIVDARGGSGVARARNAGIAVAHGRLFLPLDADDYLQPDALRTFFEAHLRSGNVIYSDFYEDVAKPGEYTVYECPDFDPNLLKLNGTVSAVTMLIPVAAWRAVGGYDEKLYGWEDWSFQIDLCFAKYCMERVPEPLWVYRKHTGIRRNALYAERAGAPKEAMLRKYPDLWPQDAAEAGIFVDRLEGRSLMGCGCSGSSSGGGGVSLARQSAPLQGGGSGGAAKVEYIGERAGSVPFRANTDAVYNVAAGDPPFWVHPADVPFFKLRDDFRIIEEVPASGATATAPPVDWRDAEERGEDPAPAEEPQTSAESAAANMNVLEQKKRRTRRASAQPPPDVAIVE